MPSPKWKGVFEVWQGGLGVWGGILLGTIAGAIVVHRSGNSALKMLDAAAPGLLLAQAIGRWGNWWNQELFGKKTTLPWGLQIDDAHLPRTSTGGYPPGVFSGTLFQPTFLYEFVYDLAGVGLLLLLDRAAGPDPAARQLFSLYVAYYCFGPLLRGVPARRPVAPPGRAQDQRDRVDRRVLPVHRVLLRLLAVPSSASKTPESRGARAEQAAVGGARRRDRRLRRDDPKPKKLVEAAARLQIHRGCKAAAQDGHSEGPRPTLPLASGRASPPTSLTWISTRSKAPSTCCWRSCCATQACPRPTSTSPTSCSRSASGSLPRTGSTSTPAASSSSSSPRCSS